MNFKEDNSLSMDPMMFFPMLEGDFGFEEGVDLQDFGANFQDGAANFQDGAANFQGGTTNFQGRATNFQDGTINFQDSINNFRDDTNNFQDGTNDFQDGATNFQDGEVSFQFSGNLAQNSGCIKELGPNIFQDNGEPVQTHGVVDEICENQPPMKGVNQADLLECLAMNLDTNATHEFSNGVINLNLGKLYCSSI